MIQFSFRVNCCLG